MGLNSKNGKHISCGECSQRFNTLLKASLHKIKEHSKEGKTTIHSIGIKLPKVNL